MWRRVKLQQCPAPGPDVEDVVSLLDVLTDVEKVHLLEALEVWLHNTCGASPGPDLLAEVDNLFADWCGLVLTDVPVFNLWALGHDRRMFLVLLAELVVDPFEELLPRERVHHMIPVLRRLVAHEGAEVFSTSGP